MSKANKYVSSNFKDVTTRPYQDLVPEKPPTWTSGYKFKKLSFLNETKCTVIINGTDTLKIDEYRGFSMGYDDPAIESFVVVEEGTIFELIATY